MGLSECRDERLLSEDREDIRPVPDEVREAWEPRKTGYSREQYEADKKARERRDAGR